MCQAEIQTKGYRNFCLALCLELACKGEQFLIFIYMQTTTVIAYICTMVQVTHSAGTIRKIGTPGPEAEICARGLDMTLFPLKVMGNGAF